MRRVVAGLAFLLLGLALPSLAQEDAHHLNWSGVVPSAATPQCGGGIVYDDGGFSDAYSYGDGDPGDATMVMRFDLPAGTTALDQVCVAFTRLAAAPSSMSFEIVVYDNNGSGGQPGTLLGVVPASAPSLPTFPSIQFFSVSLAGAGIVLPDNSVYIGVRWPGGSLLLAGDRSASTTQRTIYGSGNQGISWNSSATAFPTAPPRAMAIRADVASATPTCVPTATALCLNNNRFRVEATWETTAGLTGVGQVVKLTDETGYFWFFSSTNVEVVLKVLNGCGLNSKYWIFAGGLTDVRTVITVTDTKNGTIRQYVNPIQTKFQPIQDTSAFATCP